MPNFKKPDGPVVSTNRNPRKAICSKSNHGPGKSTQWKGSFSAHTISLRHIPP